MKRPEPQTRCLQDDQTGNRASRLQRSQVDPPLRPVVDKSDLGTVARTVKQC